MTTKENQIEQDLIDKLVKYTYCSDIRPSGELSGRRRAPWNPARPVTIRSFSWRHEMIELGKGGQREIDDLYAFPRGSVGTHRELSHG